MNAKEAGRMLWMEPFEVTPDSFILRRFKKDDDLNLIYDGTYCLELKFTKENNRWTYSYCGEVTDCLLRICRKIITELNLDPICGACGRYSKLVSLTEVKTYEIHGLSLAITGTSTYCPLCGESYFEGNQEDILLADINNTLINTLLNMKTLKDNSK